jgi:hypothetical protein
VRDLDVLGCHKQVTLLQQGNPGVGVTAGGSHSATPAQNWSWGTFGLGGRSHVDYPVERVTPQ